MPEGTLKKVTMSLTERDIENTNILVRRLHSRNKASAVSSALAISEGITRRIAKGGELQIKDSEGRIETIIFPELENTAL